MQRRWLHQHAKASQLHQQPKIDCAVSSLDSAQSQHAATPALNFQPAERILKSLRRPTTHAEASPTEGTACASRPAFVSTDPSLDDKILQQSWRSSNSTCSSEAATSGFLFHSPAETSQGRASSSANPSSNSRWPAVTAVDGPPRVPPGLQQPPSLLPAANSGCKPSDAPCDLENTSPQVFNKSPRWGASVGVTPIGQPAEEPDIEGLVPEPGLEGQLSRQIQVTLVDTRSAVVGWKEDVKPFCLGCNLLLKAW